MGAVIESFLMPCADLQKRHYVAETDANGLRSGVHSQGISSNILKDAGIAHDIHAQK